MQARESTLYQSWLPRDLSQPSNNSYFGCIHGTRNIEKGAQGSWEPYYSFSEMAGIRYLCPVTSGDWLHIEMTLDVWDLQKLDDRFILRNPSLQTAGVEVLYVQRRVFLSILETFGKIKGPITNVTDMHDFISGFRWCKSTSHSTAVMAARMRTCGRWSIKFCAMGFFRQAMRLCSLTSPHVLRLGKMILMPWGDDGKGQQCLPFGPGPFRIRQGQHQQRSFSRHSCANVLVQFLRFIRIYRIWSTQRWCVNLHKSHRFSWNEMKSCHVVKGRRRDSDAREAGYLQMHCQRESSSLIGTLEYIENMNMTSMTMTMFWIIFGKLVCASQFEPNLNLHASSH